MAEAFVAAGLWAPLSALAQPRLQAPRAYVPEGRLAPLATGCAWDAEQGASSWSSLLPCLVGLTLAGATQRSQRRQSRVAAFVRRNIKKFGDQFPPRTPEFLLRERQPGELSRAGFVSPPWLTLDKWNSFNADLKRRGVGYYLRYFDENGNPAFNRKKAYSIAEAVSIIQGMNARAPLKFAASFDLHMKMNLNAKFPDQQIRMSVALPHGTGKKVRVAVYCQPDEEQEMLDLGADVCGKKLADDIAAEKIEFDVLLAKPQMMPALAKLGKVLGPKRLMPSPKAGTVVTDIGEALKAFKKGTIELRSDTVSNVHCTVGKVSFPAQQVVDNVRAVLQGMADKRPDGAKKEFWTSVYIGSTMSPGLKIMPSEFPVVIEKVSEEDDEDE